MFIFTLHSGHIFEVPQRNIKKTTLILLQQKHFKVLHAETVNLNNKYF